MTRTFLALGILPLLMLQGAPSPGVVHHVQDGTGQELMDAKTRHAQNMFRHLA